MFNSWSQRIGIFVLKCSFEYVQHFSISLISDAMNVLTDEPLAYSGGETFLAYNLPALFYVFWNVTLEIF
jgi:hypothetical protein